MVVGFVVGVACLLFFFFVKTNICVFVPDKSKPTLLPNWFL